MDLNFLPQRFTNSLSNLDMNNLSEIRLRINSPTKILYGKTYYLGQKGIVYTKEKSLMISSTEIQNIIHNACDFSVYAYNDEIKQGYLTLHNGIRIGICGEVVLDGNKIKTIKNFSSLNIRIPHFIKNCSLNALPYLYNEEKVFNTFIISPPGVGKTTFLRDLSYQLSSNDLVDNILVVDERNEIYAMKDGISMIGDTTNIDIYSNCSKEFGIINGIRTMAPNVIFVDEIATENDFKALNYAFGCGVTIFATAHAQNYYDFKHKPVLNSSVDLSFIDRFVVLSKRNGLGTIEAIYDNENICLYGG